jgi:hypothetical protein
MRWVSQWKARAACKIACTGSGLASISFLFSFASVSPETHPQTPRSLISHCCAHVRYGVNPILSNSMNFHWLSITTNSARRRSSTLHGCLNYDGPGSASPLYTMVHPPREYLLWYVTRAERSIMRHTESSRASLSSDTFSLGCAKYRQQTRRAFKNAALANPSALCKQSILSVFDQRHGPQEVGLHLNLFPTSRFIGKTHTSFSLICLLSSHPYKQWLGSVSANVHADSVLRTDTGRELFAEEIGPNISCTERDS